MELFLLYFAGSFVLHLAWENVQAPLYAGYESFTQHFPLCLQATLTGDMVMMLLLYLLLALLYRDFRFLKKQETFSHPATWIIPSFVGALFAIIIELHALVEHRWSYTDAMPILPFFPVGLAPVLQMMIVPLILLFVLRFFVTHQTNDQS